MASVKKGHLTVSGEWWKHLKWFKRIYWKAERRASRRDGIARIHE